MKTSRLIATVTVGLALVVMPATALASDPTLDVQDRCDPVTFDAALGDGACSRPEGDGGGIVTFDELLARVQRDRAHGGWRLKPESTTIRGGSLDITMSRGGEGHTVTEVASFGHGCVPELNALVFPGDDPFDFPAACDDQGTFTPGIFGGDLIAPGLDYTKTGLSKGVHRLQCMIHPWMKSTVTVR